ncbi:MAG: CHAP domain-containing protein [Bacteroidales bacterium]|nr:CHAP domain-containing protein [Bacteroidales bacterium]
MNNAEKVIAIALAEEGYLEKSKSAYLKDKKVLDSKVNGAGSENYTKYGRDMNELYPAVMNFPAPWCDCFVDWCFYKAYGIANAKALLAGDFDDLTSSSAQLCKNKNAWHTSNPQPGDQIFFIDSATSRIGHTGLVYKVSGGYVYTIEGNTSNASGVVRNGGCVSKKSYSLSYRYIAGYGRPKYDVDPNAAAAAEAADKARWQQLVMDLQKALNAEFDANLQVNGIADSKLLAATPTLNARIRSTRPKSVKALQAFLTYWGYKCLVDGDFYTATEKMVKSFQRDIVKLANPDGEFTAQKKSWKLLLKL